MGHSRAFFHRPRLNNPMKRYEDRCECFYEHVDRINTRKMEADGCQEAFLSIGDQLTTVTLDLSLLDQVESNESNFSTN